MLRPTLAMLVLVTLPGCFSKPGKPADTPDAGTGPDAAQVQPDGGAVIDAAMASADGQAGDAQAADGGVGGPDAALLSAAGMAAAACPGNVCTPAKVASYWAGQWDAYAVVRTVRFQDVSATEMHLVVTDGAGHPASLDFTPGIPVSLIVVNPGDTTANQRHDLTAPKLFRAVAWRRAKTLSGEFRAAYFDSFDVRRRSGSDLSIELDFVPISPGTYDVFDQIGVPSGNQYEAIVAGTISPDLSNPAGHAGKGAWTLATIEPGSGLALTQPPSPLGSDPRRYATASIWAAGTFDETYRTDPVQQFEFTDDEYAFIPAALTLSETLGHVVRVQNADTNLRAHGFSTSTFLAQAVIREAQDADVEVETSMLTSVSVNIGKWMELFVVPTRPGTYGSYCDVGVQLNADGTPKLTTGHAAKGMVGTLTVTP